MDIYAANVMDHYKDPRNYGELAKATSSRHEANSLCGDKVDVDVLIEDEVLKDARFRGEGCAISQAGASILLEELIGMKVTEVLAISREDVVDMLGVPVTARRKKCATLALLALKNAILEARGEQLLGFEDLFLN